jgi:hypothetical protein
MPRLASLTCITTVLAALLLSVAQAGNLPADHPSVDVVKIYLGFVTEQNWKEAAKLVRPSAIERKRAEAIATLKNAPTMSDEAAVLDKFGVNNLEELKALPLVDFFAADRAIFHGRGRELTSEELKKKRQSLKITVIGVAGEADGKTSHLVLRTYQEVRSKEQQEVALDELIFISAVNEEGKWLIAPDSQRPNITPLKAAAEAPAPEAGASKPKAKGK